MNLKKVEIYFTPGEYDFAKQHLNLKVIKEHGMMILCELEVSGLHEIWHTAVKYSLTVLKP